MPHNSTTKPILIVMCGLMGSGKSTIAMAITDELDADLIRSDKIRKKLANINAKDHHYEHFGKGIYSKHFFDSTYDAIFEKASSSIKNNRTVIIDASFKKRKCREKAKKQAESLEVPFLLIETVCSDDETIRRLADRVKDGRDVSDGHREIYELQKADFEPVTEFSPKEHVQLDMKKGLKVNLGDIIKRIKELLI